MSKRFVIPFLLGPIVQMCHGSDFFVGVKSKNDEAIDACSITDPPSKVAKQCDPYNILSMGFGKTSNDNFIWVFNDNSCKMAQSTLCPAIKVNTSDLVCRPCSELNGVLCEQSSVPGQAPPAPVLEIPNDRKPVVGQPNLAQALVSNGTVTQEPKNQLKASICQRGYKSTAASPINVSSTTASTSTTPRLTTGLRTSQYENKHQMNGYLKPASGALEFTVSWLVECAMTCERLALCNSFFFDNTSATCQLNAGVISSTSTLLSAVSAKYYEKC